MLRFSPTVILPVLALAMAALPVASPLGAAAPTVVAAWSQITGDMDAQNASGVVPPSVEMRFVIGSADACSNYTAADGKTVTVAGPASIGQNGALTMVSIGDTGCRGKQAGHGQQDCETTAGGDGWPFPELSTTAAASNPDLVIHVGDYRYFYEHDNSRTAWVYWQKDFFPAAQPLLLASPWVFIRGNHESCDPTDKPFGAGYFQLFGWQAGETCKAVDAGTNKDGGLQYMKPWFFDVLAKGQDAGEAHRFVIIDATISVRA